MPRTSRIVCDNAVYHILNRGHDRRNLFSESDDFKSFKDIDTTLDIFSILVGPNNSGKTNFRRALLFLRGVAMGNTISESLLHACGTLLNIAYDDKSAIEFSLDIMIGSDVFYYTLIINKGDTDEAYYVENEKLYITASEENKKTLVLDNKKGAELEKEAQMKATERERQQQEKTQRSNIEYQNRLKENQEKNLNHHTKPEQSLPHDAEPLIGGPSIAPNSEARAQFEAKQREALNHKAEVQRRLKEKAESKTPTQQPHP